ncbi:MAG: universal stress protein [Anaerolineales bacterium]
MFQHILLALDGSRFAERALEPTLQVALRFESRVTLVRVVATTPQPVVMASGLNLAQRDPQDRAAEIEMTESEAYLNSIRGQWSGLGIPVHAEATRGDPAEMIVDTASAVDADLIVMTTHGRSGLSRLFNGSVAEGVLRSSPIPILLIPVKPVDVEKGGAA